ncbi:hypothetical protein KCP73_06565 [Salmonella enterica subsp. enterica]|nr:hypothetical protein KCP73_06565 [Salmonella enterica subsp. enterica]
MRASSNWRSGSVHSRAICAGEKSYFPAYTDHQLHLHPSAYFRHSANATRGAMASCVHIEVININIEEFAIRHRRQFFTRFPARRSSAPYRTNAMARFSEP